MSKVGSKILNGLSIVFALILFVVAITEFREDKIFSGILFIIGAILVSPLSKLFFKNKKQIVLRIARVGLGVIIPLFAIIASINADEQKENQKIVAEQNQVLAYEEKTMTEIMDSLNIFLTPKSLSVCEVIDGLIEIENICIQDADNKYPDYGKEHSDYTQNCIDKEYESYKSEHQIEENLFDKIILCTLECTEEERKQNIEQLEQLKEEQEERKELIEDCFGKACNALRYQIKNSLNNPESFEHISCEYGGDKGDHFLIKYTYRGQNSFGAIITDYQHFKINPVDCSIIEQP